MEEKIGEERLNNDEFRELIPYLQLDDIFLIQIKDPEWLPMVESVFLYNQEQIRCNVCDGKPIIKMKDFKVHMKDQHHRNAVKVVGKFYHPVYTNPKDRNSEGEDVMEEDSGKLDLAKRLASLVNNCGEQKILHLSLDDIMNIMCYTNERKFPLISHGKLGVMRCVLCNKNLFTDLNSHFREPIHTKKVLSLKGLSLNNNSDVNKYVLIQNNDESDNEEYEKISKGMLLKDKPKKPHLHLVFEMPFEELLNIEYLVGRSWIPMLAKVPNQPSLIKCVLCGKVCTNANLHGHLMGKQHKKLQLHQRNVRHKTNGKVNKYSSFSVGPKRKIQVSIKAKKAPKIKVGKELRKAVEESDCDVTKCSELSISNASQNEYLSEEEMGNLKGVVESDDWADFTDQPKLSQKVAAKAKALQDANTKKNKSIEYNASTEKPNTSEKKLKLNVDADDGLIGVEYVVKVVNGPSDQNPMYECCLCEVFTNEYSMQDHLTGYNHRYKYCEMHYSSALKKYLSLFSDIKHCDMSRVMGPILSRVAFGIEEYHGRSIPRMVLANDFKKNRPKVIAELYCSKHASQLYGPSYTNIFSEVEIKKIRAEKNSFKATEKRPTDSPNRFAIGEHGLLYCKSRVCEDKNINKVAEERSRMEKSKDFRRRSRSRSPNYCNKVFPIENIIEKYSNKISPDKCKQNNHNMWQRYRQQVLISASEVERAYVAYRKNPESHPLYDQEWNRFWKKRKDELTSIGVDHRKYNFQSEWVNYFKARIEELFGEALQQAKVNVRMRLNIHLDTEEDAESPYSNFPEKMLQDIKFNSVPHLNNYVATDAKSLSHNNRELKHFFSPNLPVQKKPRVDTDSLVMQWNSQKHNMTSRDDGEEEEDISNSMLNNNEKSLLRKPDVKHVLRLMAAFEDYLGSLGPKITEMLYMTLSLDKSLSKNPLLLEQKVLTPNNCSLLETAMEKLRGILYAGLLDTSKKPGFNQVIKSTEDLLIHADNKGYRQHLTIQGKAELGSKCLQRIEESNFPHPLNWIETEKTNFMDTSVRAPKIISRGGGIGGRDEIMNERMNQLVSVENQLQGRQSENYAINSKRNAPDFNAHLRNRISSNSEIDHSGSFPFSQTGDSRYHGFTHKTANINDSYGRKNINDSNQSNNYKKINYPNVNSTNYFGGFSADWKFIPNNSNSQINQNKKDKPNVNNKFGGGHISALQQQNLHQLHLLRQQQQQRDNWQN